MNKAQETKVRRLLDKDRETGPDWPGQDALPFDEVVRPKDERSITALVDVVTELVLMMAETDGYLTMSDDARWMLTSRHRRTGSSKSVDTVLVRDDLL